MVCLNCPPNTAYFQDLYIDRVTYDEQVKPGDTYHIYIDVGTKAILLGDYGRVCLYNGSQVIAQSKSFYLKKDEKFSISFTGTMPDEDLYLNVSLVDEQVYGFTDCADGQAVHIKKGAVTIPVDPIPSEPGEGDDEDEQSIIDWLMDNIVLVLMLVLVIILVIKFG
ncbi:MAG: hypothetical protein KAJ19_10645 [Gammaproteobacteria bacterium]|nr:hypothetical protein [Gammaproteobacteria bacterium]